MITFLEERFGFPELCVVGLSPVACRGLFDLVVDAVAASKPRLADRSSRAVVADDAASPAVVLPRRFSTEAPTTITSVTTATAAMPWPAWLT